MVVQSGGGDSRLEYSKNNWEANYNNKSLSGIEFKDISGKTVHFVVINNVSRAKQDKEASKLKVFRTVVELNEEGGPILPEKQTFDELIQEKRRQQAILYNSSTSGNACSAQVLTHRRAINAVRRIAKQTAAKSAVKKSLKSGKAPVASASSAAAVAAASGAPVVGASSGASPATPFKRSSVKSKQVLQRSANGKFVSSKSKSSSLDAPHPLAASQHASGGPPTPSSSHTLQANDGFLTPTPAASFSAASQQIMTSAGIIVTAPGSSPVKANISPEKLAEAKTISLKALDKKKELGNGVDPKIAKALLRSAPAGATVALPDGTLVKKSRRGGARAGAGRKRSRPYPPATGKPAPSS